jgi:hypothetical protein
MLIVQEGSGALAFIFNVSLASGAEIFALGHNMCRNIPVVPGEQI